jgi:hypothetical protein
VLGEVLGGVSDLEESGSAVENCEMIAALVESKREERGIPPCA